MKSRLMSLNYLITSGILGRRGSGGWGVGCGGMGKWGSGEVGKWGSGEVGKWGSGEVGKWGSG
ncbi:MAG: DUF1232 domain-containing protein, partial [Microcystis sp. M099S2]|nr:DUF1232 domain-containing protein [Microcystis sp. M099S2]MCA2957324.1 DUF1232 domain-containing protein [Microcystis sp. M010S1]